MLDYAAESKIVRRTERKILPSPDHVSFLAVVCRVVVSSSCPVLKTWSEVTCVSVGKFCYIRRLPPELCIIRCYSPCHLLLDLQTAAQSYVAGLAKGSWPRATASPCLCICASTTRYHLSPRVFEQESWTSPTMTCMRLGKDTLSCKGQVMHLSV